MNVSRLSDNTYKRIKVTGTSVSVGETWLKTGSRGAFLPKMAVLEIPCWAGGEGDLLKLTTGASELQDLAGSPFKVWWGALGGERRREALEELTRNFVVKYH